MRSQGRWIDISMPLQDGLRSNHSRAGEEGKISYDIHPQRDGVTKTVRRINTRLHVGTHVDGPEHLILGARRLDDYPIDSFVGRAIIVDMCHRAPRGEISTDDLEHSAAVNARPGNILIIRTGWNARYKEDAFFTDSPYLHPDAGDWLGERKIKMVVVDFLCDPIEPSAQIGGADAFKIRALSHDVLVMTNADNLDQITAPAVDFFGFPMAIVPSEAAPARAVVWQDDGLGGSDGD